MTKKNLPLYLVIIFTFFCFGGSAMLTGAALPGIISEFKWNYNQTGIMLSVTSLSFFITAAIAGRFLLKYNLKYMIILSLALMAVSLFLFGMRPGFYYNVVMKVLFGIAFGVIEVCGNFIVSRMEKENESHLMGFLHAAFSVGAVAGPFLMSIFLKHEISWKYMFRFASAAAVCLLAVFFFVKSGFLDTETGMNAEVKTRSSGMNLFSVLSVLIVMFYVGYEVGISDWGSEFLVRFHEFRQADAASLISIYWAGLFAGRILNPFIFRRLKLQKQLLLFSVLAVSGVGLMLAVNSGVLLTVIFAVTGYGCASIYPLVMTIIGRTPGINKSSVMGMASAGGGLGGLLFPFTMSRISNAAGVYYGFMFFLIIGAVQVLLALVYFCYTGGRKAAVQ